MLLPWMDRLIEFVGTHPGLELNLVGGDDLRNLTRREADIALRFTVAPPEHLVGRRLAEAAIAVYAAHKFADEPLETMPWVGWDQSDAPESTADRVRKSIGATGPYVVRVNSYALWLAAGRRGAGALTLPCVLGDVCADLQRRTEPMVLPGNLWILTHPDLRRSPRIRRTMQVLAEFVATQREALLGQRGWPSDGHTNLIASTGSTRPARQAGSSPDATVAKPTIKTMMTTFSG